MSLQSNIHGNKHLLVTGTVLFYLVAALAMIMANKWVLQTTSVPLFFLFAQLVIAVILFLASHAVGLIQIPLHIDGQLLKGLAPMVALNVVGLSFSNYTLKYVDASFYQVARGLVLPFTVATSYAFLDSRPSLLILFSCSIVTLGFFVGVFLDGVSIPLLGVGFGITSSAITAVHSVIIKKNFDDIKSSAIDLSWYTNLLSAVVLIPLVALAGEVPAIMDLFFGPEVIIPAPGELSALSTFVLGSLLTGAIGFLMSVASLLSIKVTSPITHMISSAVRSVAGSLLAIWLFGDVISNGRASSIAIILGGSIYYTWVKHVESQASNSDEDGTKYERVPLEDVEAGHVASETPESIVDA
jgi:GDP-fucose transporter C1